MLGLTSGIHFNQSPTGGWSYQFDFSSAGNMPTGFQLYPLNKLTGTYGTNAPGQSTGDWLKIDYSGTQTGSSGLRWTSFEANGTAVSPGQVVTQSAQFYLPNDSGKWDPQGDTDPVDWRWQNFGTAKTHAVNLDEVFDWSPIPFTYNSGNNGTMALEVWTIDDRPQDGAVAYIRNWKIEIN
jgi:hypothetical protein